jgi:hypothetical protein
MAQNFGDVRVHEGHQATLVGTDVFTKGEDIFFRPGAYRPHEEKGASLIAHELTHVVQQRGGHAQVLSPEGTVEVSGEAPASSSE